MTNQDRGRQLMVGVSTSDIQALISGSSDDAAKLLIEIANKLGAELKQLGFTTSQIRNVFGVVRSLDQRVRADSAEQLADDVYRELLMLKPKLAYQKARASTRDATSAADLLKQVFDTAIDTIGRNRVYFERFMDFFEAILAYHRYHGGRN